MEESELLKERLQAITDKRKIQEDIAKKRTEVDEEKLKLQYLKKKALREQWLQDGVSVHSSQEQEARRLQAQGHQQQAKLLQINIQRMEQEIESLERQEMVISRNESFILKRLRAIEKSPLDIIKEAKTDGKKEPAQIIYSALPDIPTSYKSPDLKKQKSPDLENKEHPKKSVFAMEINVQKDLRTGESRVLSTAAVTDRGFQQKGVKVYDDGRKSVYALGSEGQVLPHRVDELTPAEVEELLRKAKGRRGKAGAERHEPGFSSPCELEQKSQGLHRLQENCPRTPPELCYMRAQARPLMPHIPHPSKGRPDTANGCNPFSNGYEAGSAVNVRNVGQSPYLEHREDYRMVPFDESKGTSRKAQPDNSKVGVPTDLDSTEPVTMIFMGYQRMDDEDEGSQQGVGYEGAIRAELVVIDDEDDQSSDPQWSHQPDDYRGHSNPRTVFQAGSE
ncbi:palmdelphin [Conger conger]|uniref:palmdelphin n=1 Tax=Conger conger TaxID=82655 RepID=UPI002A59FB0B|nr:palmdelphin [Conger conger]XP_061099218.1 palmdelphin [Conger conger]